MADIGWRTDLKTTGGEMTELLLNGCCAGTLALVYEAGGRIAGTVRLSENGANDRREQAMMAVRNYVQQLQKALAATACDVAVLSGETLEVIRAESKLDDRETEASVAKTEAESGNRGAATAAAEADGGADELELVPVRESRGRIEYRLYGASWKRLANIRVRLYGSRAEAEAEWRETPVEAQLEHAAKLLAADLEPQSLDLLCLYVRGPGKITGRLEWSPRRSAAVNKEGDRRGDVSKSGDSTIILAGIDHEPAKDMRSEPDRFH